MVLSLVARLLSVLLAIGWSVCCCDCGAETEKVRLQVVMQPSPSSLLSGNHSTGGKARVVVAPDKDSSDCNNDVEHHATSTAEMMINSAIANTIIIATGSGILNEQDHENATLL